MKKNTVIPGKNPLRLGMTALALSMILCGCAQEAMLPETTAPEHTVLMAPTSAAGLYTSSDIELQTRGAVRTYPLGLSDARGLEAFGDGLLLFSGEGTTVLTRISGENLEVITSIALNFSLSSQDPSLRIWERELSYFDPVQQETVVLDSMLNPVTRVPAPPGCSGTPVLSEDRNTLFYCTARGLFAWDLEADIHRRVKEMAYPGQSVVGLHARDSIVQCTSEDGYLFLAADTGRLVTQWNADLQLQSQGDFFYAAFSLGFDDTLVFGTGDASQILLPETPADHFFLPQAQALVAACQTGQQQVRLDCYDLGTGRRISQLMLNSGAFPTAITGSDGLVSILIEDPDFGCDTIYRWDVAQMPLNDGTVYTAPYLTDPQEEDLAQCQAYAREIAEQHGIELLIGTAAAAVSPWDYDLYAEIQPAIILQQLQLLEQWLACFPEGMLASTASDFASLKLCLVRRVTGTAESGSVSDATGVQFLEGTDCYVAIAAGRFARQALYHELFHVMETHIFNYSIAFDQWDTLNPTGFRYDYSYSANALRDSGIYLQGEHRAFIDTYSMSFPKEDRARIFEYAMLPDNAHLFVSEPMQGKLKAICSGIREAYHLEDAAESFQWEQYLSD